MSGFLIKPNCDRCKATLKMRTISCLNEDVICFECSKKEIGNENWQSELRKLRIDKIKRGNDYIRSFS